mgnify:CR=1 FL=1
MTRYIWKISIFMPSKQQTDKPGKICYTKNFNLSEITLKTEEKNVIELKENEQSNINFNYVKTSPDHRTAGNLAH